MTREQLLDEIERALLRVTLATLAALAVGWAAYGIGILPAAAEPLVRPLMQVGGLAAFAFESIRIVRMIRRSVMRWTCAAVAVALGVMMVFLANMMAHFWPEGSPVTSTVFATGPLVAAGLFADAVVLHRRAVPRLGPLGAAAGGVGLLAFMAGTLAVESWVMIASLPLLAFAGFAFFCVRGQLRATLPASTEDAVRVPAPRFR